VLNTDDLGHGIRKDFCRGFIFVATLRRLPATISLLHEQKCFLK